MQELQRSTQDCKEIELLTYVQMGHLDDVHNIDSSSADTTEYTSKEAIVLVIVLDKMVYKFNYNCTTQELQLGQ